MDSTGHSNKVDCAEENKEREIEMIILRSCGEILVTFMRLPPKKGNYEFGT